MYNYKVVMIMEKVGYEERPKVVVIDKLGGKSYVTFNFGVEPSAEGYSGYSATVVFADGKETADGVLYQLVTFGMIRYVKPEEMNALIQAFPSEDPLSLAKDYQKERIRSYDSSEAVNQFSINGSPMWLDKATRAGLKLRLEAERSAGKENTTLWYGTEAITLPVSNAIIMLNRLEIYASESYDVTQGHLARVALMESVEEVLGYDFTEGYPDKLNF